MCDTLVGRVGDTVLFAKSSDRDANEAQILDWQPRRHHPEGAEVRCTWITIPQVTATHAVLLSRPFWMWGAEMGANEHGVVIGNEAVFTRQPLRRTGLTGMDLLRLALERASNAEAAVETLVELLERHGQGGGCGYEDHSFSYHNSFLVADPKSAWVLETADRQWASEKVEGSRSISNGLTIPAFAERHGKRLEPWVARASRRRQWTTDCAASAQGPADLMQALRHHEGGGEPYYRLLGGTLGAPCMHGGGVVASSVTTASWISELSPGGCRHWATATSAPCLALFKPVAIDQPIDLGQPIDIADSSLWWRHERIHRRVLADPERLALPLRTERDALESRWLAEPPDPETAFAEGDRLLERWQDRLDAEPPERDVRPPWVRHYWRRRSRAARLGALR